VLALFSFAFRELGKRGGGSCDGRRGYIKAISSCLGGTKDIEKGWLGFFIYREKVPSSVRMAAAGRGGKEKMTVF